MIVRCATCGTTLADIEPGKPCPQCGETVRAIVLPGKPPTEPEPKSTIMDLLLGRSRKEKR